MRRVLMVSPHFPPDATAAAHRLRIIAPHLPHYGWLPTIVTVDPGGYDGALDTRLADLVPRDLRVIRCRAWRLAWTRRIGVGDLGLRALAGLRRACLALLAEEPFDALFITIYPTYPAILGPMLKKRFGIPFVLDYQDPWVGAWGERVGGGANGSVDFKSRVTRRVATALEPRVVAAADAITAVSADTCAQVLERYRSAPPVVAAIPVGVEPADVAALARAGSPNAFFDPCDGRQHVCYVGTLLPLGMATLTALLGAIARLRDELPALYARAQFHFFGTSNQRSGPAAERVMPIARQLGVAGQVTEVPLRIDYVDALRVQMDASAVLLLGSSEPHYTASKIYPALIARRPILAAFHERSSAVDVLRRVGGPSGVRLTTYGDDAPAGRLAGDLFRELTSVLQHPPRELPPAAPLAEYSGEALAGRLAAVLDRVVARERAA